MNRKLGSNRTKTHRQCHVRTVLLLTLCATCTGAEREISNDDSGEVLARTVLNIGAKASVRKAAFKAIIRKERTDREDALLVITRSGSDHYRIEAATLLIRARVPRVYDALLEVFNDLSPESQTAILKETQMANIGKQGQVLVHSVLRAACDHRKEADIVGLAAVLCADSAECDCDLLRSLLPSYTEVSRLWLVLGASGCIRSDELEHAKREFEQAADDSALHIALACTLSKYDSAYLPLCEGPLVSIIDRYADQTQENVVLSLQGKDGWRDLYLEYQVEIHRLGMLRWLDEASAKRIVEKTIDAANRHIRLIGLVIALKRWPSEIDASRFEGEEIAAAYAFLRDGAYGAFPPGFAADLGPVRVLEVLGGDVTQAYWGWFR